MGPPSLRRHSSHGAPTTRGTSNRCSFNCVGVSLKQLSAEGIGGGLSKPVGVTATDCSNDVEVPMFLDTIDEVFTSSAKESRGRVRHEDLETTRADLQSRPSCVELNESNKTFETRLSKVEVMIEEWGRRQNLEEQRRALETRIEQFELSRAREAKKDAAHAQKTKHHLDKLDAAIKCVGQAMERHKSERSHFTQKLDALACRIDAFEERAAKSTIDDRSYVVKRSGPHGLEPTFEDALASAPAFARTTPAPEDGSAVPACTSVDLNEEVQRLRGMIECMQQVMPRAVKETLAFLQLHQRRQHQTTTSVLMQSPQGGGHDGRKGSIETLEAEVSQAGLGPMDGVEAATTEEMFQLAALRRELLPEVSREIDHVRQELHDLFRGYARDFQAFKDSIHANSKANLFTFNGNGESPGTSRSNGSKRTPSITNVHLRGASDVSCKKYAACSLASLAPGENREGRSLPTVSPQSLDCSLSSTTPSRHGENLQDSRQSSLLRRPNSSQSGSSYVTLRASGDTYGQDVAGNAALTRPASAVAVPGSNDHIERGCAILRHASHGRPQSGPAGGRRDRSRTT